MALQLSATAIMKSQGTDPASGGTVVSLTFAGLSTAQQAAIKAWATDGKLGTVTLSVTDPA